MSIAYQDLGDATGIPVLLIIGADAQMIFWPEQLIAGLIASGYRVIRYDNRDKGLSTKVPAFSSSADGFSYSLQDMTNDAVHLLEYLHVDKAHIVGVSMGGMIAQIVAAQHAALCFSLTLIVTGATGPEIDESFQKDILNVMSVQPKTYEEHVEVTVETIQLLMGDYPLPKEMRAVLEEAITRDMELSNHNLMISNEQDRIQLCESITVPTCIIAGEKDPLFTVAQQKASQGMIKGSSLYIIQGMGHILPDDKVDEIENIIMNHFKAQSDTTKAA